MNGPEALGKTILIVDPNELNTKLYRDLLTAHGHTVITTERGGEAILLARQHRPNLILLETYLLGDVHGLDLIRSFKADAELKSIPIIAVTGAGMKGDEERIRASGCDEYIAIPISLPHFMKTVESFLE